MADWGTAFTDVPPAWGKRDSSSPSPTEPELVNRATPSGHGLDGRLAGRDWRAARNGLIIRRELAVARRGQRRSSPSSGTAAPRHGRSRDRVKWNSYDVACGQSFRALVCRH